MTAILWGVGRGKPTVITAIVVIAVMYRLLSKIALSKKSKTTGSQTLILT